jgi:hypothetical protein
MVRAPSTMSEVSYFVSLDQTNLVTDPPAEPAPWFLVVSEMTIA